jgi:hypothetical protein
MELKGNALLAARMGRALGRVLIDRLDESVGRALPRTPEQIANADVINALVEPSRARGGAPLPRVRSASLPGVRFESSNCTNFLVELEYEAPLESAEQAPRTAYVKLPCAEIATRVFANAVGFWEVETTFCERVASRVPVRVPRVYAVARRGARFVLLLENLCEIEGVRLFDNRDMAAGTTVERARMCLRAFAELHSQFWGWSSAQRDELVPARLHTYLAPGGREMTRALNAAAIGPARRAAPDLFSERHAEVFRDATEKWDALVDAWYAGPLTLIHGDSHLANLFEYPGAGGPRMGMIDFQGMHWCHGVRDVQYFLINSLDPKLLAENEEELIDFYVNELAARGVQLDANDARHYYRAYSFQTLMVAVTSIGLGALTERTDTVRTVLERSLAASERLRFREWLEEL